jgi:hypothetical protein
MAESEKEFLERFKEARKTRPDLNIAQFSAEEEKNKVSEKISSEFDGVLPYLEDEQVFILDYFLYNYAEIKKNSRKEKGINELPETTNAQKFLNEISIPNDFEKLINIKPSDYARLTPSYEIFKVLYDGDKIKEELPFIFSNFSDLSGLYDLDATFRGHGAGIKSATITLDGKNNVLSHMVSLKLTLMFQDINTIWTVGANGASYVDLFSYPNKDGDSFYRIKMLLGYNGYQDTELGDISLRYSKLLMLLDYKSHTIEINENGTCKVVVDYTGALEYVFTDPEVSNIVSETKEEKLARIKLEAEKKAFIEAIDKAETTEIKKAGNLPVNDIRKGKTVFENAIDFGAKKTDEEIRKENTEKKSKTFKDVKEKELSENYAPNDQLLASRLERLLKIFQEKLTIFQVDLTIDEIADYRRWLISPQSRTTTNTALTKPLHTVTNTGNVEVGISGGPLGAVEAAVKQTEAEKKLKKDFNGVTQSFGVNLETDKTTIGQKATENLNNQFTEDSMNSRTVGFVLLKDLLSAILENIGPLIKERYKREFEILFGTITFQPPGSDHQIALPIGDIPISLTKLNYFFVDKLIGKNMTVYTFQQFFEDLFNDFFVKAVENAMRLRSSNDTIQKNSFNLDYLQLYGRDGKFTVLQEEGPAPQLEVLFIYGNSVGNVETFNSQDNLANKIPHMYFGGVDRGIVKKIKFADNTNAKTKAAIWEQNRGDNSGNDRSKYGGTLAPLVYNADATLIGYPYIINGNTIFIDTAALGLNEGKAVDLLLGGYYVVTKVVHELTVDKFETKISAILTADYRLKGKIKEKVNIVSAEEFKYSVPKQLFDQEMENRNKKRAEEWAAEDQLRDQMKTMNKSISFFSNRIRGDFDRILGVSD